MRGVFALKTVALVVLAWIVPSSAIFGALVGRHFPLSNPATTSEWMFVFETLIYSEDRESSSGADAIICLKANGLVAAVLEDLYNDERLVERRDRIARPFAGFQSTEAARVALAAVRNDAYAPSEPIVSQGARAVLKHFPEEGAQAILEKLNFFGELPDERDMDEWGGMPLLNALLDLSTTQSSPAFWRVLFGERENYSSGARLGAACGLYASGENMNSDEMTRMLDEESNPMVKECISKILDKNGKRETLREDRPKD